MRYRGIVISGGDLSFAGWPELLEETGLNLLGIHSVELTASEQAVVDECRRRGIEVEHELHLTHLFMDEALYAAHPDWFAMDVLGKRDERGNPCVSQPEMLELARQKAAEYAQMLPSNTHRYHFWAGDNHAWCNCEGCARYSPSEQNVILMNAMLEGVRAVDLEGRLAYLAYLETLPPPRLVGPADALFLEFAPYRRNFLQPLDALTCRVNAGHVDALDELLTVFAADRAQVLEYWLDVSYWSNYQKPAVRVMPEPERLERDLALYAARGLEAISTFACWMDKKYFDRYGADAVSTYGHALKNIL